MEERALERARAIAGTVAAVRRIEAEQGVTRESLMAIRSELLALAAQRALFPEGDFPPPEDGSGNRLYILSMDDDRRFALYLNRGTGAKDTPPHNHTTWAVVVGVAGEEHNKFYRRLDGGSAMEARLELADEVTVRPGSGVCLLPDDIHSIHMRGDDVKMHLHMYGRAISEMKERVKYDLASGRVEHFPPHPDAR